MGASIMAKKHVRIVLIIVAAMNWVKSILAGLVAVFLFSKYNNLFFGYFDPENIFFRCQKKNPGYLTDISAKKKHWLGGSW